LPPRGAVVSLSLFIAREKVPVKWALNDVWADKIRLRL
jgi:hypothetical protein